MRALILAVLVLSASACNNARPCKANTLFVNLSFGDVAQPADQVDLEILVNGSVDKTLTVSRAPGRAAGSVEVDFAGGYPAGKPATLVATARAGGTPLASQTATVMLAQGCTALTVELPPKGLTLKQRGEACGSGDGCIGTCVDGYCCDSLCADSCRACNLPGSEGTCTPIAQGNVPPHGGCPKDDVPSCGHDGTCDGMGACFANPACGTLAPGQACTDDPQCAARHCLSHVCCEASGTSCVPSNPCHNGSLFLCGSGNTVCVDVGTNVTDGTNCGANQVCNGGTCGACVANRPCIPNPSLCRQGVTSCSSGTQICADTGAGCSVSCQALRSEYAINADGTFTIDPDGPGGLTPYAVFCYGMADSTKAPKEFLTLAHSKATNEPDSNFARYAGGGYCQCTDMITYFTKVRLLYSSGSISVDHGDETFAAQATVASPAGCTSVQSCNVEFAPDYGHASSCVGNFDASGTANMDLRDTPFKLGQLMYTYGGGGISYNPGGTVTVSGDRKTANVTGGGACGNNYSATAIPLTQ